MATTPATDTSPTLADGSPWPPGIPQPDPEATARNGRPTWTGDGWSAIALDGRRVRLQVHAAAVDVELTSWQLASVDAAFRLGDAAAAGGAR